MLPERSSTIMASGAMEVKRPVSSARQTGADPMDSIDAATAIAKRMTGFFFMPVDLSESL